MPASWPNWATSRWPSTPPIMAKAAVIRAGSSRPRCAWRISALRSIFSRIIRRAMPVNRRHRHLRRRVLLRQCRADRNYFVPSCALHRWRYRRQPLLAGCQDNLLAGKGCYGARRLFRLARPGGGIQSRCVELVEEGGDGPIARAAKWIVERHSAPAGRRYPAKEPAEMESLHRFEIHCPPPEPIACVNPDTLSCWPSRV